MKITIRGNAKNSVLALVKKAANLGQPVREATLYMERETKLNFARETDPDGKPWTGLAAATLRHKRTNAILRETGTLANSVAAQVSGTVGRVEVGAEHGIWHQTGTRRMPQRRIIGISEARHIPRIEQIFEEHFQ
ncbi:MAG: phage virion morphogenesis protein [Cyanobacteria bacterium P01_F01_bin.13]